MQTRVEILDRGPERHADRSCELKRLGQGRGLPVLVLREIRFRCPGTTFKHNKPRERVTIGIVVMERARARVTRVSHQISLGRRIASWKARVVVKVEPARCRPNEWDLYHGAFASADRQLIQTGSDGARRQLHGHRSPFTRVKFARAKRLRPAIYKPNIA